MNISRELLVGLVRKGATSHVDRIALASALVRADWLIDVFVDEAREDGVPWSELTSAFGSDGASPRPGQRGTGEPPASRVRPRPPDDHDGKYRPLWAYLREAHENRLDMSFADVERILGFALPPSSRNHQPHWYGYKGSAVARAVIDAGWKAQNVDLVGERVAFIRTRGGGD